jgi:hypothetical protein
MGLTTRHRDNLERLRSKYRVKFEREVPSGILSSAQAQLLEDIRELGRIRYADYAANPTDANSNAPWKLEAKTSARALVKAAQGCELRNEASWRHACEPLVFARVNSEVAWFVEVFERYNIELIADRF